MATGGHTIRDLLQFLLGQVGPSPTGLNVDNVSQLNNFSVLSAILSATSGGTGWPAPSLLQILLAQALGISSLTSPALALVPTHTHTTPSNVTPPPPTVAPLPQTASVDAHRSLDIGEDSVCTGNSCHQCKQSKPSAVLAFCSNLFNKRTKPESRQCRKKYCDHCLNKFYDLDFKHIKDRPRWICLSCQGSCTCAACVRNNKRKAGDEDAIPDPSRVDPANIQSRPRIRRRSHRMQAATSGYWFDGVDEPVRLRPASRRSTPPDIPDEVEPSEGPSSLPWLTLSGGQTRADSSLSSAASTAEPIVFFPPTTSSRASNLGSPPHFTGPAASESLPHPLLPDAPVPTEDARRFPGQKAASSRQARRTMSRDWVMGPRPSADDMTTSASEHVAQSLISISQSPQPAVLTPPVASETLGTRVRRLGRGGGSASSLSSGDRDDDMAISVLSQLSNLCPRTVPMRTEEER